MAKNDPLQVEKNAVVDAERMAANSIRARHRSPNYPFIGLEKAIERTRQIYDKDRRHDVPIKVACEQRWSYKPGGSQADQTIGALKSYGLIEVNGTGDGRTIKISDRAHRILLNAPDAPAQLRDAALSPAINGELWGKYGADGLPTNDVIRHYLIFDRHFNEDVVDSFIANFRETISFAKLDSSGKIRFDGSADEAQQQEDNEQDESMVVNATQHVEQPLPPSTLRVPPAGMRQAVYPGETGDVTVRWPAVLTAEDYADLEGWLDMLKGKLKRSIKGTDQTE